MFRYAAFGLIIDSPIEIPELVPCEDSPDVQISLGLVPYDDHQTSITYVISQNKFAFKINDLAKFLVRNGNEIIIEPLPSADFQTLRVYLLGTAFGVLLIQRCLVPIHGSAIEINSKAVILTGNCGAGKSTLASWFLKSGFNYLSDDISVISMENNIPFVSSSFEQRRVNLDSALMLGFDVESLTPACSHDEKFIIKTPHQFISNPIHLSSIIQIEEASISEVTIEKIKGIKKIHTIVENVYCSILFDELGFSDEFFNHCVEIAKSVSIYKIRRPKGLFTVEEQMRLILKEVS